MRRPNPVADIPAAAMPSKPLKTRAKWPGAVLAGPDRPFSIAKVAAF
jgi:hypothetical protein